MKEKIEQEPEYLTEYEAAAKLRKSTVTLWRMRRDREIPFYRMHGRVLYKTTDVEAYLEGIKQAAVAKA